MANVLIQDLSAADTLTGSELVELQQTGAGVRTTTGAIAALASGGGIPQGGPLTEDLDFNGFAAENVGTMTAAYIVGISGGNTSLDGGSISTDGNGNLTTSSLILSGQPGLNAEAFNGTSGNILMDNGDASNLTGSASGLSVSHSDSDFITFFSAYSYDITGNNGQFVQSNGDATNLTVSGNALSGLFDGTGIFNILEVTFGSGASGGISFVLGISGSVPSSDGSISGLAAFQSDGSLGQGPTPIADGTYTVGLGVTTNGTITIASGIITAVQQAS